jgi:hypothetical protein
MIGTATTLEPPRTAAFPGTREVTTRPLGLSPAAHAVLLRALRFRYFKWDTHVAGGCRLLPEAIVLSRRAHDEIVRIVEGLHQALGRFEQHVRRDAAALARLSIPAPLIRSSRTRSTTRSRSHGTICSPRATAGGWCRSSTRTSPAASTKRSASRN